MNHQHPAKKLLLTDPVEVFKHPSRRVFTPPSPGMSDTIVSAQIGPMPPARQTLDLAPERNDLPSPGQPLGWDELARLAPPAADLANGTTNAQANLRLFGYPERAVRVTLYRDHHAWCPYCQKVWLWLEEKRIPYRIRKVTMVCFGEKEGWYRQLVPSGKLPAIELDGRLITESDTILEALEQAFGVLGHGMAHPQVLPLRRLERQLFASWCQWLCATGPDLRQDEQAGLHFDRRASAMAQALEATPGPFLLEKFSSADVVFVPYLERMNASLAYYKGYLLRQRHAPIDRWFAALEQRSTYLGTQADFHTHVHDLPPQMGCCQANGSLAQRQLADRIDRGPWPIGNFMDPDPETSQPEPADAALQGLARVLRHREPLLERYGDGSGSETDPFSTALRCVLTRLVLGWECPPPAGTAKSLRSLAQRISVPRDMSLYSARRLRQALQNTAALDPLGADAWPAPLPLNHRRDQDPLPFLRQSSMKVV